MRRARTVYISHNSGGSALVHSQVLPYLVGLAAAGFEPHLLTFEDRRDAAHDSTLPLRWSWLPKRQRSGLAWKARDVLLGVLRVAVMVALERPRLIHARSYLPATIAMVVGVATRTPYIFDMRGFLGEEYAQAGHWSRRSFRYRLVSYLEVVLIRRAAATVVLTRAAREHLRRSPRYRGLPAERQVTVIPCAVDLATFTPSALPSSSPTVVHLGSLGAWYLLDEMLTTYVRAKRHEPDLRMLFINQDEHERIRDAIQRICPGEAARVQVVSASPQEVPRLLARCHVGIIYSKPQRSVGTSPIKAAEYLASGLPVVTSSPLGDLHELVRKFEAGHVLERLDDLEIDRAAAAVATLVRSATHRSNARRLAEAEYGLPTATARYVELYRRLAGP